MLGIAVFNPSSDQAAAMTHLFNIILIICGVIFGIVTALITYSLVRFRARGQDEPRQITGSRVIEVVWTLIPFLLLVFMFYLTASAMNKLEAPSDRPPDLTVIGHQWWWEVRYLKSGVVTANEIHIPVGQKWLVQLGSADVIHDFWAPRLSRKMDMVPGHTNHIWLAADQPGIYLGACAEYCGAQHAWMRFTVIAQPVAEFNSWQQQQSKPAAQPASPSAQRGLDLLRQKTCLNCHALGPGTTAPQAGPDLGHVASRQTLAAGLLQNTPGNLARWLKDPQSVKPGTLMPKVQLSRGEVEDLVNYLVTLK